jgi:hypothetical protein
MRHERPSDPRRRPALRRPSPWRRLRLRALRPEASPLVGRRFGLRLPFGCTGPAAEAAAGASWVYSADRRSVRIVVRPETWTGSALIQAIAAPETYEAVEGFWVTRPWLLSEDCPALPTDPTTTTPSASSPETLGLGVFFEEGGSRVARRDQRPYEIVLRLDGAPRHPRLKDSDCCSREGSRASLTGGRSAAAVEAPINGPCAWRPCGSTRWRSRAWRAKPLDPGKSPS